MTRYADADPATFDAIHRLLVHVMSPGPAPTVHVIGAWRAYDRALVRSWAERELARKMFGHRGNPHVATPFVMLTYTERLRIPAAGP